LSNEEAAQLRYMWEFWARPEQLAPPDPWSIWLIKAGRGWGKTRVGAEWVRHMKDSVGRIALIGPTAADVRDVMVDGDSGIIPISPPWDKPEYQPSKRRVVWQNGSVAYMYSADEPERLRGPQHGAAWCDEAGSWRYPDTWDMMMFGLRLGKNPKVAVTTTPRPTPMLKQIQSAPNVVITRGTTYENRANLAASFFDSIITKYEGTRLGRQELEGHDLDDSPGAMWNRDQIDKFRIRKALEMVRIVVAIDPAVTSKDDSDETGIVVVGKDEFGHAYVLEDCSIKGTPDEWGRAAIQAMNRHQADRIVAEVNQGGDMVRYVLETIDKNVPVKMVRASRGKVSRAEPVSALYEQGKVHHVGVFHKLEDQMCTWEPGMPSPDRMDAMVWGMTELMLAGAEPRITVLE
jgi:predicted phage terminase large subunit-like protein